MQSKIILTKSLEDLSHQIQLIIQDEFQPTLAIIFASPAMNLEVLRVLFNKNNIQIIRASTSGEIENTAIQRTGISLLLLDMPTSYFKIIQREASFQQSKNILSDTPYFAHIEKNFKNKPKLQIEMFDIFLDQLPLAIEQMGKGLAKNDLKVFHYDAHRIKSTINIIGLPKLKPLITKMDEYCYKKINLEQLPELYAQFKVQATEDTQIILARKEALLVIT